MASGHAVVDGSNLATEGRTEPSLKQLDEAVRAFDAEFNFARITVIVDATFEHRVSTSERRAAREAIDAGEIITPPAGVIGRGDAFILQVADKADAVVLSNDSFQEFHGTYPWLFDDGRLVGGKPVPGVGWIYVARSPVRGPVSRRATSAKKAASRTTKKAATKTAKKSATRTAKKATRKKVATTARAATKESSSSSTPARSSGSSSASGSARSSGKSSESGSARSSRSARSASNGDPGSNDTTAWERFRRAHPVGSEVRATVDRFSSHGAYADAGGLSVYLPNRLLGDPAPSRARDVIDVGEQRNFVVHRYDADRGGIDAGLIAVPGGVGKAAADKPARKPTGRSAKKSAAGATKRGARKSAAKSAKTTTKKRATTTAKRTASAPVKKTGAKKTTTKASAKKAAKRTSRRRR